MARRGARGPRGDRAGRQSRRRDSSGVEVGRLGEEVRKLVVEERLLGEPARRLAVDGRWLHEEGELLGRPSPMAAPELAYFTHRKPTVGPRNAGSPEARCEDSTSEPDTSW